MKISRWDKFKLGTVVLLVFASPGLASAATITVTSGADAGGTCPGTDCTLRQAIATSAAGGRINFSLPANGAVMLTSAELLINKNLTIEGPSTGQVPVTRGAGSFRVFEIAGGVNVAISGLAISQGTATGTRGGGILNGGTLALNNCIVSGNSADNGSDGGGGIFNSSGGQLTIASSVIAGNSASNTSNGGGGISNAGILTVTNSTISGNVVNNSAAGVGGGLYNNAGTVTITNSTISGNSAATGTAGGIWTVSGSLTLTNSTVYGNSAPMNGGGGIYASSNVVTLTNCTVSGNSAFRGGGIFQGIATVNTRNTIIALNTASDSGPDIFGSVDSQGFTFIGSNRNATITSANGDQIGTAASPKDPVLGPLQSNGGLTKTQALLSGSPAIEAGNSSGANTDQRGFARPVDSPVIANASGGDGSDIGAYEVQADQLPGCSNINTVVNNNNDSGAGSLREVITNVCAGSTVTFAPTVRGLITLTSGELPVVRSLTIRGPGAKLLSLQRSTAIGTPAFRIFNLSSASSIVVLSDLMIANGISSTSGGGISSIATLTLSKVAIAGNTAVNGGGIFNNAGMLSIGDSTISDNSVSSNSVAGSGGGIFNSGGALAITNSTISGNTAVGPGGNSDSGGGIFTNVGTVTLTNTTIAGNSADFGGGVRNLNGGLVKSRNTIIALNTSANGPDFNGPITSLDFNLIGNSTGATVSPAQFSDQIGTTVSPVDPLLGPLQDNTGPTLTRASLAGSPAIDKGDPSGSTKDQRGLLRTFDIASIPNAPGGGGADIGAFEFGSTFYPVTLANISTRLRVGTGDNVLIGGFIIAGTQPKKVILRGIGPSLSFAERLANPNLDLRDAAGTLIDSNDNWVSSPNKQAIIDSTIPPTNDLESAIVANLPANNSRYTAILSGVGETTGIGLVEAYDLDGTVDSKLANISTRGFVQPGDNVLIAGVIVFGQTSQSVIVRAIGPSLPVQGTLNDPTLELRDGNGTLLEANDNWMDSANKQAIIDSTIPPTNPLEAAIVRAIAPGNYTAIVSGLNGTSGIALVEVYALN